MCVGTWLACLEMRDVLVMSVKDMDQFLEQSEINARDLLRWMILAPTCLRTGGHPNVHD